MAVKVKPSTIMDQRLKELKEDANLVFKSLIKHKNFDDALPVFQKLKKIDGKICERLAHLYNTQFNDSGSQQA